MKLVMVTMYQSVDCLAYFMIDEANDFAVMLRCVNCSQTMLFFTQSGVLLSFSTIMSRKQVNVGNSVDKSWATNV